MDKSLEADLPGAASDAGRRSRLALLVSPVFVCFVILALYFVWMFLHGSSPNGDADDLVKLHELRTFIATGNIFDRTLPDIVQPEPYISHWPWIVDLPYALVAWPLTLFLGSESALSIASFLVPLLLLAPTIYFYNRLLTTVGFSNSLVPLLLATVFAIQGFLEFEPYRIDYHNLQILLLFTALTLVMSRARLAAFTNGLLVSLALAVSFEFAGFHALIMAVYAFDFVFGREGGTARLKNFGAGLAVGAFVLFAAIVPPSAYAVGRCDTYSAPYALAVVLAGLVFAGLSAMGDRRGQFIVRVAILCGLATASAFVVLTLFPQCAGGPYAALGAHLRAVAIDYIPQEKSLLHRPDIILSDALPTMTILFIGALAPAAFCILERRRERPLVIIALFSLLAFAQTVAYFRYLRYLPFFSGIGLLLIGAMLLPSGVRGMLAPTRQFGQRSWRAIWTILPGLGLSALLVLYYLVAKPPPLPSSVLYLTGACQPASSTRPDWPAGSVVLSPPLLGAELLAQTRHPGIVAVPNHPAALGIDRVDRFLDPGNNDPRKPMDESRATHVVLCDASGGLSPERRARFPFAASLMNGQPPQWLVQCPAVAGSSLRIYSYRRADGTAAACPTN